jgi:hypothetical protein
MTDKDYENPVLKRIIEDIEKAKAKGVTTASSHSSYVLGAFEPLPDTKEKK